MDWLRGKKVVMLADKRDGDEEESLADLPGAVVVDTAEG